MSATIKNTENNTITLEIVIDKQDFDQAIDKAYKQNRGRYQVQGFRKGKAPRKIIEAHYGKGIFYEEAIENAFPKAYQAALEELEIEPSSRPILKDVTKVDEDGAVIEVEVAVKPEVKLSEYKGAKIKALEPVIGEDKIQAEIDKLLNQNARMVSVEDTEAQNGDTVNIDFEGFVDDVAFPGGQADGYSLQLGSGSFIPGFEDQLVGAKTGDNVDVKVTFPEEYHAPELAGKDAIFKVKVNEVLKKELPEFDDEFVKDISEFDTVDELKDDTKKKLEEQEKAILRQQAELDAINYAIDNAEVVIPELMIEEEAEQSLTDMNNQLKSYGLGLDQYIAMSGMDRETFINNVKEDAEKNIKLELVLEQVVELENLEATEEEIEKEYEKLAEQQGNDIEMIKHSFASESAQDYLKAIIKRRKAIDLLVDSAVVEG